MPCASAPNAPWVEVWLSPQTIVVPGRVKPCSGPTMWTMPWRLSRGPQSLERLRAGDFVHQMAVDIEQAGAVLLLIDHVVVPDLVVECAR
jgi:hypothetical protein